MMKDWKVTEKKEEIYYLSRDIDGITWTTTVVSVIDAGGKEQLVAASDIVSADSPIWCVPSAPDYKDACEILRAIKSYNRKHAE